jgi:hypothetical protein
MREMATNIVDVAEQKRLNEAREQQIPWEKWGPYLSERQWGTVREDYSVNGDACNFFTHDHARSRAYRWGEHGLARRGEVSRWRPECRLCSRKVGRRRRKKQFSLTGANRVNGECFLKTSVSSVASCKEVTRRIKESSPIFVFLHCTKSIPAFG